MGVASLIIGLISFFISLIPFCGYVASIPAVIGLVLGIVYIVQSKKSEDPNANLGTAITGVVFNVLTLFVLLAYMIVFTLLSGSRDKVKTLFEELSDTTSVMQEATKQEIEKELGNDSASSEDNPFNMSDSPDSEPTPDENNAGNDGATTSDSDSSSK